jgi:hypothetical protein
MRIASIKCVHILITGTYETSGDVVAHGTQECGLQTLVFHGSYVMTHCAIWCSSCWMYFPDVPRKCVRSCAKVSYTQICRIANPLSNDLNHVNKLYTPWMNIISVISVIILNTHACTSRHTQMNTQTFTHTHIHTHTHTHTHTRARAHTYTHSRPRWTCVIIIIHMCSHHDLHPNTNVFTPTHARSLQH